MARQRTIKRTFKTLSPNESRAFDRAIAKVEADRPQLENWARAGFARDRHLREVLSLLKHARVERDISLAQLQKSTGIAKGNLSKLENDPMANPTVETLLRYAQAIGVELRINVVSAGRKNATGRKAG